MKKALISVYDKTGLIELGNALNSQDVIIYATDGTYKYLKANGIECQHINVIANNPSGYESFVSSLSFNTLIGALYDERYLPKDSNISPLDIVVYNFVPTWDIISSTDDFDIQHVDLGGPTMVKAAAINFRRVLPIVSPEQYSILSKLDEINLQQRAILSRAALKYCAWYDTKLASYLDSQFNDK